MSRRIAEPPDGERGEPVTLEFAGHPVRAYRGESVAVALYASGIRLLSRSLKYHRPRAFFCLEGHCGACLMRIGGVPNLRACLEPCRDGLTVEAQNAYPAPDLDLLGMVDWLFPRGLDHHTLMTGSKLLNQVANKVVRQLSGLGQLPDHAPTEIPPVTAREPDVVVVGGGPAGLAAAAAAASAGARTLLIDEQPAPGGNLLADPRFGPAEAEGRAAAARAAGAELLASATAIAWYAEDAGGLLAVATPSGLCRVRARRYVYATGGYAQNRAFADNDRPGVLAARAVGRLLVQHGVRPGQRIVLVGDDDYARALAAALAAAGSEVVAIDGARDRVVRARGRLWVEAVDVIDAAGRRRRIDCDLVAISALPSPASDCPRQHGCAVALDPAAGGFAVVTDADGHTTSPAVLACGDVCGFLGPTAAAAAGARTGALAAREAGTGTDLTFEVSSTRVSATSHADARNLKIEIRPRRKTILCRCEDVTAADVEHSVAKGYEDIEEVKRYTGFGTGPCQGKECQSLVARNLAELTGRAANRIPPFTARPPIAPTPLKMFARDEAAEPELPEEAGLEEHD